MFRMIPLVVASALLIAACGGSSPTSGKATAGRGLGLAFSRCMRANGVPTFPDPGSSGGGGIQVQASQTSGSGQKLSVNGVPVSAPAFQSANAKCQRLLPGGGSGVSAAQLTRLRAGALKSAECMRAHGVPNFPDPDIRPGPGGHGLQVRIGGAGVDPESPAFQAAQRVCGPLAIGPAFRARQAAEAAGAKQNGGSAGSGSASGTTG